MGMDADGFFQLQDMFAWQPIRVCNPTNPNWLPCKHIVELEETVRIHNHAKGVPDATMTSVAFQLASGPREPLKKKSAGTSLFFFFQRLFWTGCELWNTTDVIVASGTPFAWLWMLTGSSNPTICLHGSQLGLVGLQTLIGCHANVSWSWKKPSASITMQKGCPTQRCARARIRSKRAAEKKNKKKEKKKSAGTSLFFLCSFYFSGSFGPGASWNATDVIVASGTPFAWLWMLTVSSNSTICLHGSQLGFVTLLTLIGCHANISWSWKKPSASITMQKGCPTQR